MKAKKPVKDGEWLDVYARRVLRWSISQTALKRILRIAKRLTVTERRRGGKK